MLEQFKEINRLLKESQDAKELYNRKTSLIIREAQNKMNLLKENIIKKININSDRFISDFSTGKQRIASASWIRFLVKKIEKDKEKKDDGFYITFIFLPKKNSLFLTIQSKSDKYKTDKNILDNVFKFYTQKFNEINLKYNFLWKNSYILNSKLIDDQAFNTTANSYLFTSIFYNLLNLNEISEEILEEKIIKIFNIFDKVDLFSRKPWVLKHELNAFLLSKTNKEYDDEYEKIVDEFESSNVETLEEFLNKSKNKINDLKISLSNEPVLFPHNKIIENKNKKVEKKHSKAKITSKEKKAIQEYNKWLGSEGEEKVFEYEKVFLTENNRSDLSKKVKHIAKDNENAGYDILSYDLEGNEKYIEVKTSKNKINKKIHFFMSDAEKKFFEKEKNSYIYFLGDIENFPNIQFYYLTKEDLEHFSFKITNYSVTVN